MIRWHSELSSIVQTLGETVDRFIAERKSVEEKIVALMKEKPELFRPGDGENHELSDLFSGFGLIAPGPTGITLPNPEEVIPRSIKGTKLGVLANTFILGLTHDPQAIAPLLRVAAYDSEPFLVQLQKATSESRLRLDAALDNPWAIADALDRILMSDAAQSDSTAAATVARDYSKWRSEQIWPPRETIEIYPFDAPQTPFNLPGLVTGRIQKVETKTLTLPLKVSIADTPGLVAEDCEKVLEWAHCYHDALQ